MYKINLNNEKDVSNQYHYKKILERALYGDEIAVQQLIMKFIPRARHIYKYLYDVLPNDIEESDIIQFMAESIVVSLNEYKIKKIKTPFIQHFMNVFISKINNIYTKNIIIGNSLMYGTYIEKLRKIKKRFEFIDNILYEYRLQNKSYDTSANSLYIMSIINDISKKIDTLKPKHRFVIEQYFLQEKTLQEIGDILGCSRENVRQHIENAIRILKIRLKSLELKKKK